MPLSRPMLPLTFLLAALLGCGAPPQQVEFEARLKGWVGRPVQDYLLSTEAPYVSEPRPDGGRLYTFRQERVQTATEKYIEYQDLSTGQTVTMPEGGQVPPSMNRCSSMTIKTERPVQVKKNFFCRIILEADAEGRIRSVRYEGNDCW